MLKKWPLTLALLAVPCLAWAESGHPAVAASAMAGTFWGITALVLFVLAYSLVPLENTIHLRKSKPVLFAAGIIWVLVAVAYGRAGDTHSAHVALQTQPARICRTVPLSPGGHDLYQRHGRT